MLEADAKLDFGVTFRRRPPECLAKFFYDKMSAADYLSAGTTVIGLVEASEKSNNTSSISYSKVYVATGVSYGSVIPDMLYRPLKNAGSLCNQKPRRNVSKCLLPYAPTSSLVIPYLNPVTNFFDTTDDHLFNLMAMSTGDPKDQIIQTAPAQDVHMVTCIRSAPRTESVWLVRHLVDCDLRSSRVVSPNTTLRSRLPSLGAHVARTQ